MISYIHDSLMHYFLFGFGWNPFFILVIVGVSIQLLKFIIDSIKYKTIMYTSFLSAGGFPSFHSGIATSITTMVLLSRGFDSLLFCLSFAFALLVAYDAMNVRFESGKQAKCINEIRSSLSSVFLSNSPESKITLKERLGHTPIEVLGGILLSFIFTFVLYYYLILS